MSTPSAHLSLELLLQDWLGELAPAQREAVDAHLMACDACGGLFDEVLGLVQGVREAVRAGAVFAVTGGAFLERLAAQGLRVREYRLPHNGSVNCTVGPGDDVLASRLEVPLQDVRRLDLVQELSLQPGVQFRLEDVPFDPASGELLLLVSVSQVRQLPAHTMELTLLACDEEETRELGRYVFRHTPWPG